jgi:hypothetical protein
MIDGETNPAVDLITLDGSWYLLTDGPQSL